MPDARAKAYDMGECPHCGLPFTVTAIATTSEDEPGMIHLDAIVTELCACGELR